jgi:hypothetical protein
MSPPRPRVVIAGGGVAAVENGGAQRLAFVVSSGNVWTLVFAAGDATAFAIKQGGLATQQADAAARWRTVPRPQPGRRPNARTRSSWRC